MKTAAEMLRKSKARISPDSNLGDDVIELMKEYAQQAIEMCASSAMVKTEGITQDDEEGSIHYFSVVDEDSILKVKYLLI